jgi:PKD repeat protein
MKNFLTPRLIGVAGAVALSGALAGCSLEDQAAPSFTGPSEFAVAVNVSASPDRLPRDGRSQSVVTLTAVDPNGRAISAQRFSLTSSPSSAALSTTEVMTDSSGRAVFTVTAPPASTTSNLIAIAASPIGTSTANSLPRIVTVALTGPSNTTAPTPSFTVTPTSPERGVSTRFDASATTDEGGACLDSCTYSWSFGDGFTDSGRTVSHTFIAPGTYTVILTVTDAAGTSASTSTAVIVRTIPPPIITLVAQPAAPLTDQVATFTATVSPATGHSVTSYSWSFGDGTSATTSSPSTTHTYSRPGVYVATVTATDDVGQTASASVQVTVTSSVTASFTVSPNNPVPGQPVHFNGAASTGSAGATITNYAWDFGDGDPEESGASATASHTYVDAGVYTVHLVVTDSGGRTGRTTLTVTVAVPK